MGDGIEDGGGHFERWQSGPAAGGDSWTVSRDVPLLGGFSGTMGRGMTKVIVVEGQRRMKYKEVVSFGSRSSAPSRLGT